MCFAKTRWLSERIIKTVSSLPGILKVQPIAVSVYLGWCVGSRGGLPTDCFFFDVANRGYQPISIEKIGIRLSNGKDIAINPSLFKLSLPHRIGGRERRVFSLTTDELMNEIGTHRVKSDILSAFVIDDSNNMYIRKIPGRIREQFRIDYFGNSI